MLRTWFHDAKTALISPTTHYRRNSPEDDFAPALKAAAVSTGVGWGLLFLIGMPLFGGIYSILPLQSGVGFLVAMLSIVLGLMWLNLGTLGFVLITVFVHPVIYLFGGRGLARTGEALAYASGVEALLGWMPFFNALAPFYLIYPYTVGLREYHDLSTGKAFIAAATGVFGMTALLVTIFFASVIAGLAAA